jgi:hypothetical protein
MSEQINIVSPERRQNLVEILKTEPFLTPLIIDEIYADWDFFHLHLHRALDTRIALNGVPDSEEPIDSTDFHAFFLLAHAGDTSVIPKLLDVLRLPEDDLDLIFGDTLTEQLCLPVAQAGHHCLSAIKKFFLSTTNEDVARYPLATGLIWMPYFHPDTRGDIVSFFTELSTMPNESFAEDDIAGYFCECADAKLNEIRETAFSFARSMKIDPNQYLLTYPDDVFDAFSNLSTDSYHPPLSVYGAYADMMLKWGVDSDDIDTDDEENDEDDDPDDFFENKSPILPFTPSYLSSPKIGRNDPCFCGSGKKYKNCHGKDIS